MTPMELCVVWLLTVVWTAGCYWLYNEADHVEGAVLIAAMFFLGMAGLGIGVGVNLAKHGILI